jgi:hypothetical protein
MKTETKKSQKRSWAIAILVGIIIYVLVEGWPDFKAGYVEAYRHQTGTNP